MILLFYAIFAEKKGVYNMKKNYYLILITLLLSACGSSNVVFTDQMRQKIDAKDFTVNINTADPAGGPMITLTSLYSVKVQNDSIFSYLPYFGRAYTVPYGGGKALNFNEKILSSSIRTTSKGLSEIMITTRNDEDTYRYLISLSPTGTASIQVSSYNRQPISFAGNWE